MTDKLLKCPFCGGEAFLLEPDESSTFYRVGCKCAHCIGANAVWHAHTSEAEAIAAWNTRAERSCYADEVTHRDCKYSVNRGWKERTCRLIRHGSLANMPSFVCWSCSECGFGWHHSENDKQFSFCPNCGAKVVGA